MRLSLVCFPGKGLFFSVSSIKSLNLKLTRLMKKKWSICRVFKWTALTNWMGSSARYKFYMDAECACSSFIHINVMLSTRCFFYWTFPIRDEMKWNTVNNFFISDTTCIINCMNWSNGLNDPPKRIWWAADRATVSWNTTFASLQ